MRKFLFLITVFVTLNLSGNDSSSIKWKKPAVWAANVGTGVFVQAALYKTWYSTYPEVPFHWTNDNGNWLQMDKSGHAFSAFFLTNISATSFRYAGYSKRKSALAGSLVALAFQSSIEYFDGQSQGWGASWGDLMANLTGTVFAGVQQYWWGDVKIPFSITFQKSRYAKERPNVLGKNTAQRMLKDYNAQTYWLSFYPSKLGLKSKYPKWLGISLGYGIDGCLGGTSNIWTDDNGNLQDLSHIDRNRQFYISPDFTFGHIKTRYKLVNFLLRLTDYWKLPAPAAMVNQQGAFSFHWLYW